MKHIIALLNIGQSGGSTCTVSSLTYPERLSYIPTLFIFKSFRPQ